MPNGCCPTCGGIFVRWLEELSKSAYVIYYRCETCAHVSDVPKNDHLMIQRSVGSVPLVWGRKLRGCATRLLVQAIRRRLARPRNRRLALHAWGRARNVRQISLKTTVRRSGHTATDLECRVWRAPVPATILFEPTRPRDVALPSQDVAARSMCWQALAPRRFHVILLAPRAVYMD
jgi:hypothetical protein